MVFSSINPIYLDPPNWQLQEQSLQVGATNCSSQLLLPPLQPSQTDDGCSGVAISSIRQPGSMTERARLAKIPLPEPGLKCPRCDSTNTKFCYFNNYNLSQPRHFCKTCRRYWTRGGALRNVPVGGGCRRNNKRNKGTIQKRPKSPALAEHSSFSGGYNTDILSQIPTTKAPALPLLPPLNHLGDYNLSGDDSEMSFGGLHVAASSITGMFQVGSSSSGILEQFRSLPVPQLHHFPFLTSFGSVTPPSTVYSFDGDEVQMANYGGPVRFKAVEGIGLAPGVNVMKAADQENNNLPGVNLSKNISEISVSGAAGNEHIWSGNSSNINAWTDLSGFSNSSPSNH